MELSFRYCRMPLFYDYDVDDHYHHDHHRHHYHHHHSSVSNYQVLTPVTVQFTAIFKMAPCTMTDISGNFAGTYRLASSFLKTEVAHSSESR
jgi:hypothetical protein